MSATHRKYSRTNQTTATVLHKFSLTDSSTWHLTTVPQLCLLPAEALHLHLTARNPMSTGINLLWHSNYMIPFTLHRLIAPSASSVSRASSAMQSNQQTVTDNTTSGTQHNQQITANNTLSHTQSNQQTVINNTISGTAHATASD